ncbi:hypothetical protein SDC9_84789 [bioreactor metagenome]|uniref:Uncharacterized protein n=1 Tax=bioreactor metagenome TaxID=1076179 RepID=A0A644ZBA0_9ZZZZ
MIEQIIQNGCQLLGVFEIKQASATICQQFLGMPVWRGEDCGAGAYGISERPTCNLLFIVVRSNVNIASPQVFKKDIFRNERFEEDHVILQFTVSYQFV